VTNLDMKAAANNEPPVPRIISDARFLFSLNHSLALIDRSFGIDRIIADSGDEFVDSYYRQSLPGYSRLYNPWQCMHLPLHDGTLSESEAFFAQASEVARHLHDRPGQRVLELGCGLGANSLHLAGRLPHVSFVGTDLMDQHVQRASAKGRALPNLSFRQASFEDLPEDLGQFDAIFGIETLCYANDPGPVARLIARHLRPGGHVILFDAHRKPGFEGFPTDLVTATKLYEITTAVARGFHDEGRWQQAFAAAGLEVTAAEDVTEQTLAGLTQLHSRATKAFTQRKWRLALKVMPRYFARNAVAGLVGYHVCFGDRTAPDTRLGPITYQKIVARKPAA